MQFRLSTLLFSVAVVAFLIISFLQWRYIDMLETQLEGQTRKVEFLQRALAESESRR